MTTMKQIVMLLLYFVIIVRTDQEIVSYCKDDICGGSKEQTLCKISGPSQNCIDYKEIIITQKDKRLILDKINSRRNKVASGEIRSLPAAENMIKLNWSDELALSAQRWVNQCKAQNLKDQCRDLEDTSVGQNVATIKGESPGLNPFVLADLWYMELLNINTSIISSYQSSSRSGLQHYDYFTQLVWGTTTAVGCGGVEFMDNEEKVYRLVCHFAPSGNRQGTQVYATGEPCSNCPENYSCDSEYPFLCSKDENHPDKYTFSSKINKLRSTRSSSPIETNNIEVKTTGSMTIETQLAGKDSLDSFDLLSHLFEASTTSTETTQTTQKCKDVIAVEEFIRILKNKLNNEQLIRDYLFSTKTSTLDTSLSDENVIAVVKQIYSKKISSTTTSVTESDHMNSTLLANLVDAIIFRKSESMSVTHNPYTDTPTYNNVRPVKIQASLAEVKVNNEFSGHLFFPEEEEEEETNSENEITDSFYDSSNMPTSEIAFEIADISKNTRTKNFLDEVLEEELLKEVSAEDDSTSNVKDAAMHKMPYAGKGSSNIRRFKRRNINNTSYDIKRKGDSNHIRYFDLLKKIANDILQLKLRQSFSCLSNKSSSLSCEFFLLFISKSMIQRLFAL